ncbi:MAG: hypothetical protein V4724_13350 [Pseudomonadota bacterium]
MNVNKKARRRGAAAWGAAALLASVWSTSAQAYRPFEGTDAAVAEHGLFELEFSPLGYVHLKSSRSLVGPALVANYGFAEDYEVVAEGKLVHQLGQDIDGRRNSLNDSALSIKHVLRHGSLQEDGGGVSIASECGVLLPDTGGDSGTGASCSLIFSQKLAAATVHLNTALSRTREHANGRFLGVIVEGNQETLRPVMEIFAERDNHGGHVHSALVGAIWKASETLSFDAGLRRARDNGENLTEVRIGLTWSHAVHKGS